MLPAGGVGLLLTQMAKMRGAHVIGTVSTEEKAQLAREAGADEVILYTQQDFVAEVDRITGGAKLHVVYDSVGKDTFDGSLDCLAPRGYLVLFGQSSGRVPPVDPQVLNAKGVALPDAPYPRQLCAHTGGDRLARERDIRLARGGLAQRSRRRFVRAVGSGGGAPAAGRPPHHGQSAADPVAPTPSFHLTPVIPAKAGT